MIKYNNHISFSLFLCFFSTISYASHQNLVSALELTTILPQQKASPFENKIKGMWLLGAYGDAQARVTEFITNLEHLKKQRPDSTNGYPIIPSLSTLLIPSSLNKTSYAKFTDDTHMSLYLADALLATKNQPIEKILNAMTNNLITWSHADQTDRAPGIAATNNSRNLETLKKDGVSGIDLWSRNQLKSLDISRPNQGLREELFNKEGGSGAVMRTAPISIIFKDNPEMAEQMAVAQGVLTHTDSGSRAACAGFNAAILAIFNGASISDIWKAAITTAQKYDSRPYSQSYNPQMYPYGAGHFSSNGCAAMCQQAQAYFNTGLINKPYNEVLDEFRGWGATEALAATLYIFATWNNDPYIAMSISINRTPGDSDTIAKMVGELFGAQYGYDKIAQNFLQHGMNLDKELQLLENINNLSEYPHDFTMFKKYDIKTFNDLVSKISFVF